MLCQWLVTCQNNLNPNVPQKATLIVTRFFERCPLFREKQGKKHIGTMCRFDVPSKFVNFTDLKCADSAHLRFIMEHCSNLIFQPASEKPQDKKKGLSLLSCPPSGSLRFPSFWCSAFKNHLLPCSSGGCVDMSRNKKRLYQKAQPIFSNFQDSGTLQWCFDRQKKIRTKLFLSDHKDSVS